MGRFERVGKRKALGSRGVLFVFCSFCQTVWFCFGKPVLTQKHVFVLGAAYVGRFGYVRFYMYIEEKQVEAPCFMMLLFSVSKEEETVGTCYLRFIYKFETLRPLAKK